MNNEYQNLPYIPVSPGTLITQKKQVQESRASLKDAAISMMTDFSHVKPFATPGDATIDDINSKMIACGVRLLFVAEHDEVLLGLVTYNDIYGEKPLLYIQEHGGKRGDILARDIMTPLDRLEALPLKTASKARVGDIVETMKLCGRQHLLVCEEQPEGKQAITGLFSSTHIEKQLRTKIEITPRANSFADIERALT